MSYFDGFTKKAVVVVPPHHILRQRTAKRNQEMGQPVPEDAINAMKGERGSDLEGREREREEKRRRGVEGEKLKLRIEREPKIGLT